MTKHRAKSKPLLRRQVQELLASRGLGEVATISRTPPSFVPPVLITRPTLVRHPEIRGDIACVGGRPVAQQVQPWRPSADEMPLTDEAELVRLPEIWTAELVRAWIAEAMATLRILAITSRDRPADMRAVYPDVVREAVEAYGWGDAVVRRLPTAAEIARLDVVLPWLFWLDDPRDRKIVAGVAMGLCLRTVGKAAGVSHTTARTWERRAVAAISAHLNGED